MTTPEHNRPSRSFSTQVDPEIKNLARAAVRGVSRATGRDYTLSALTEEALLKHIKDLAETYNDGKPWPTATDQALRPGRRISD